MKETNSVKSLKKQLMAAIAMVCVAAIALGTSTYAWFVSNTQVSATSSSVKATSATPNLLIVKGGVVGTPVVTGGKTSEEITSTEATALYPASTDDCSNWWAVSGWESGTNSPLANAYYKLNPQPIANGDNVMNGQYTQGSTKLNAYQVSTYSVYTTTGEVELNLDPTNPISVDITGQSATDEPTGFKDALRIGIVVDGVLKLVYAPTAETGKGNDKDAQTGYRTVDTVSTTKAVTYKTVAANTFTGWTAINNNDGTYTKATNSLGTVRTDGSVVQIYVWLEGTDEQCTVGSADSASDADSYKVSLNFVGATVNAAP